MPTTSPGLRRRATAAPPPVGSAELERARRALQRYDKGSLIRIGLRLGCGSSKELAAMSREAIEACILRAFGRPDVIRGMLEGLSPLQLRLLEMAAGQYGVVEVADLLRTAMQAVPPQTTDPFDGYRADLHERHRRAMPVVVELYSRGLLWPLLDSEKEDPGGGSTARPGADSTGGERPTKRSLVGAYHLLDERLAWVHPFVRYWLDPEQDEGFEAEAARQAIAPWWLGGGLILAAPGPGLIGRGLEALIRLVERDPVRVDKAGRLRKAVAEALVEAASRDDEAEPSRSGATREGSWSRSGGNRGHIEPTVGWASGDVGWGAFVLAVALGMGLVERSGNTVKAKQGSAEVLQRLRSTEGGAELIRRATAAWLTAPHFNELSLCPELVVTGCPPYDEPGPALPKPYQHEQAKLIQSLPARELFQGAALRARRVVLQRLRALPSGQWVRFETLSEELRWEATDFLLERQSADRAPRDPYRGLFERTPDGRALPLPAGAGWRLVEERVLARMLLGPLLALGIVTVEWDEESGWSGRFAVTPAASLAGLLGDR